MVLPRLRPYRPLTAQNSPQNVRSRGGFLLFFPVILLGYSLLVLPGLVGEIKDNVEILEAQETYCVSACS